MEVETLQTILSMLEQAGHGAFWAFLIYVGQFYLSSILTFVGVMLAAYFTYRTITTITWAVNGLGALQTMTGRYCGDSDGLNKALADVRKWREYYMNNGGN